MPSGIRHAFVSNIPDGPDTTLVRPSDWNAEHTLTPTSDVMYAYMTVTTSITLPANKIFYRLEEIKIDTGGQLNVEGAIAVY